MGRFEAGWRLYEWRKKLDKPASSRVYPQPEWLGVEDIAGKTLFLHWEQGLGDTIQFCRYARLAEARGARVIMEVQQPLYRLLRQISPTIQIIGQGEKPAAFDYHCPLLSLPLAFRTTLETIPAAVPYLHADPDRAARWRHRLAALPGHKVGLVWAGDPNKSRIPNRVINMDQRRSITLAHFSRLAEVVGVSFVSLQKGEAAAQARTPPEGMVLHDWTDELHDFADTAALVEALDLVISVDTSVVHLTGALGKPVWMLNRYDQCWRWLLDRIDSPWYPTARLFRQQSPGDWHGVIRAVAAALRAETAQMRPEAVMSVIDNGRWVRPNATGF